MSPVYILSFLIGYFALLLLISYFTGKGSKHSDFFIGGKSSPWYLVAFGMIGASLSGVTFISITGQVKDAGFTYMQMVFGYLLGYLVIGTILMPLYYRLNLTSIYGYLEQRFGAWTYKTGAGYFLLSRTIGASFRLFLIAIVLQEFVFQHWNIPFEATVALSILLIWIYTFRGGIKTVVYTDTLQTFFMILTVILTIIFIVKELSLGTGEVTALIAQSDYSKMFVWDWQPSNNFFKFFLSGAFITITMTGLDQDMMQKNLSCRNIKDAQKNMLWFSIILVVVNFLFLCLGSLLYIYADAMTLELPAKTDQVFPTIALNATNLLIGSTFIVGLIAAAYSSADSALTSLTTSFCVDFLNFQKGKESLKMRYTVHIGFSVLLFMVIVIFRQLNNDAVIYELFKVAGYTYGPLLGLYSFGLSNRRPVKDRLVPVICILSPVICFLADTYSADLFNGFQFGFLILPLNGLLTFLGLLLVSEREKPMPEKPVDM